MSFLLIILGMKNCLLFLFLLAPLLSGAQAGSSWNGKSCAVVLTYDDGIDIDLDHVAPALDSFGLRGTFYVIGSSPSLSHRMEEWRTLAARGNELGNHTSFHPCDGTLPGRSFVRPETDLFRYTISRMTSETRFTNTLLHAIDGRTERTFAFPCGDKKIGDTPYYTFVKDDFVAARGVQGGLRTSGQVDLSDVNCYMINGQDADYMTGLVKEAMRTNTLLVFLFHGVGGGHNLNVSSGAHTALLRFLKEHEKDVWVAPMVEVASFIRAQREK